MLFLLPLLATVVAVSGAAVDTGCCGRAVAAGPVVIDNSSPTTVAPVPDVMDWLKRNIANAPLKASPTRTSATGIPVTTSRTSSMPSSTPKPPVSGRAVFAHYMVGTMTSQEAMADIQNAQAMGLDAFALNVVTATQSWSTSAVQFLFSAANAVGFKLFFSFDMTQFQSPTDFLPMIQQYYQNPSYYQYNGLPFVSTYYGGTLTFGDSSPNSGWEDKYKSALASEGIDTYFVPAFSDSPVDPSQFFNTFSVVDGVFYWDGSWPWESEGLVNVTDDTDRAYLSAARAAGKAYMMGISALQFKHLSYGNWFRRGGPSLMTRIPQILSLAPDFVEMQTFNDAGESHYFGKIWPEAIAGSGINSYTDGFDHTAWQILLVPFLNAYKSGVTDVSNIYPASGSVSGVFWHATLLTTASCAGDSLGRPSGMENMQDAVEVAVLVAQGVSGLTVNVYSGGSLIGTYAATQGLNSYEVQGMTTGAVRVEVVNSAGKTVVSGQGPIQVAADSSNCNYNPQVVALG